MPDGRIPDAWKDKPAKLRQKDRDARWTVKYTKAKPREDGIVGFFPTLIKAAV